MICPPRGRTTPTPLGSFTPHPWTRSLPKALPEASRGHVLPPLWGFFLQLLGLIFLFSPPSPPLLQALCPWEVGAGRSPWTPRGERTHPVLFHLVPPVLPHIYAFTLIFCYRCIHYSKGNVSCFTSIKLYKLEA